VRFVGDEGDDRFENSSNIKAHLLGGGGNDTLIGGSADDWILGGIGHDRLEGGLGNDKLEGEAGNDTLIGNAGNDELWGSSGDDSLVGGADVDYIYGGAGNDVLDGNEGNDKLRGEDGNDRINGFENDDELVGGNGDDVLDGGAGVDALSGEGGRDTLFGQAGNDWLSGGLDNDVIHGGFGEDYILGAEGDDLLHGDADNDRLYGDAGNDELHGLDGDDYISGDIGDDRLTGGLGDDYIYGGAGADSMEGNEDDDHLFGDDGDDQLYGHAGIDQLVGGSGHDFLIGGLGDDLLSGDDGHDRLYGEQDDDYLLGSAGNDLLSAGTGDDRVEGGFGDDLLFGQDGVDQLFGDEGNDGMWGGAGDDGLEGGLGDDYMMGGLGIDMLRGEEGNDFLFGEGGNDSLFGGAENDQLSGGAGDDYIDGSLGHDVLVGGSGKDELLGNQGNDILIGGLDVDNLRGEEGEDILLGGATLYDANTAKLQALSALWSAPTTYEIRMQFAENQLFTARLQSEDTVFHDQAVDVLYGGTGRDWYFQTGSMPYYSPVPDHSHHDGTGHGSAHQGPRVVHEIPTTSMYALIDSLDAFTGREANEAIHTAIPHADNALLMREHVSLFELVRYDQVTHSAVRTGAWSNPSTWQNGVVPTVGARVLIPIGIEVRVDGVVTTPVATIRVDGTLSFDATKNTELQADTIIVASAGTFQMGTADEPIAAGVRARLLFTDTGAINRNWDPFGISRGLVSHGKISIHGSEVSSYLALLGAAPAGSSSVLVNAVPVGWKVNDTVVIAGTTGGTEQNESRRIVLIIGNSIYFDRPLEFSHTAPAANLQVHIANLTRNAVIESQSEVIDRRGHVMFMHNRDVHVSNAGFYGLGRTDKSVIINDSVVGTDWKLQAGTGTNQRARYPVHFHRNGLTKDGNPSVISGSVVLDSPGWGFVNHSGYVNMNDNVAFDVFGSSFSTEVGDEIGGFYGNIAIGSRGSDEEINARESKQDFGHQGDGFWFQGAGVEVVGNIAAGNQGNAFVFYTRGLVENVRRDFPAVNLPDPSIAHGAAFIPVGQVPMLRFSQNVGYASTTGLKVRYHLENTSHTQYSVIENSTFWNNATGIYLPYVEQVTLRNVTVIHAGGERPVFGIRTSVVTGNINFENLNISGYGIGIELPRWGNSVVSGGTFSNNNEDILIYSAALRDRHVLITGALNQPHIVTTANVTPLKANTVESYFVQDLVLLNFGPFNNQRLYNSLQLAAAIPFPTPRADVPGQYVGLTNQQLRDRFGVSLGNAIAPPNAYSVPYIVGVIASAP
jgi:Ca2+-binding RTX toxin-like protein